MKSLLRAQKKLRNSTPSRGIDLKIAGGFFLSRQKPADIEKPLQQ